MTRLPAKLHSAAQVREMDRTAIEDLGIPGYTLMQRAGQAALDVLCSCFAANGRVLVVCGAGNNAGDGYVLARLARVRGIDTNVIALVPPERLTGDAAQAVSDYRAAGGSVLPWDGALATGATLVVDAILGTGLDREVGGQFRDAVLAINACGLPVLALDIPSGLHADTGTIMGVAVRASHTVTFVGLKAGFYLGSGPDVTGTVHFDDLGVPADVAASADALARRLDSQHEAMRLPRRERTAHKGDHGRVLVVGGGPGMPGAVRLAGEAALRSGAGLVTVATHPDHAAVVAAGRPELICKPVADGGSLDPLLRSADVVALGPGLGQGDWSRAMFAKVIASDLPLVLDADGLNLLAEQPSRNDARVLTPHPGEAARLLGSDTASVQRDRLAAVAELHDKFGGIVVLKGAGTLVFDGTAEPDLCDAGNPGMATAGMGDVLTGVIAGLAAQTGDLARAARLGVLAHACAGDHAAADGGERGMIAGDLMEPLRAWLNRRS